MSQGEWGEGGPRHLLCRPSGVLGHARAGVILGWKPPEQVPKLLGKGWWGGQGCPLAPLSLGIKPKLSASEPKVTWLHPQSSKLIPTSGPLH